MATRKAIAAALLALLAPPAGPFVKQGRRLRSPEQAAAPGKPAIYLIKPKERARFDGDEDQGLPARRSLMFLAVIYTDVGTDEKAVPADAIDDLLDYIDAQLAPGIPDQLASGNRQTLGGLVYSARIDGETDLAPGDVQGKGTTVVPIRVWLNSYP